MNLFLPDFPFYMDISDSPEEKASACKIEELLPRNPSNYSFHWVEDPIPGDDLRYIFDYLMPKDLSKTERIKWDIKISATVSCYEKYCNTVCGEAHFKMPSDGGKRHAEKWNEFKADLERWGNLGCNYSVHY